MHFHSLAVSRFSPALLGAIGFLSSMRAVDRELLLRAAEPRFSSCPPTQLRDGLNLFGGWGSMGVEHFRALGARAGAVRAPTREGCQQQETTARLKSADRLDISGGKPDYVCRALDGTPVLGPPTRIDAELEMRRMERPSVRRVAEGHRVGHWPGRLMGYCFPPTQPEETDLSWADQALERREGQVQPKLCTRPKEAPLGILADPYSLFSSRRRPSPKPTRRNETHRTRTRGSECSPLR